MPWSPAASRKARSHHGGSFARTTDTPESAHVGESDVLNQDQRVLATRVLVRAVLPFENSVDPVGEPGSAEARWVTGSLGRVDREHAVVLDRAGHRAHELRVKKPEVLPTAMPWELE